MLTTAVLFVLTAGVIFLASEYFVNGIEWVGFKGKLGATAVGTVLAAFGTALPESAVTFVAVFFGKTPQARDIGVGAAMGGPLVLATVAYAVVGVALLVHRRRLGRTDTILRVDHRRLARDQAWFLAIFISQVGVGLVAFALKPMVGMLFLAGYAIYVWRELARDDRAPVEDVIDPLKLRPRAVVPGWGWVLLQTIGALLVIATASRLFVAQIETIGVLIGLPAHLVALLLSPIATELPETVNALIWVRQGKERLALANISGSMMIQATIPSALGMVATPWLFDAPLIAAGAVTSTSIVYLWWRFRTGTVTARRLLPVILLYVCFALFVALHQA